LWDSQNIEQFETRFDWEKYNTDQTTKRQALDCFSQLGYFVLFGPPAKDRQVLGIIESFGFVARLTTANCSMSKPW